MSERGRTIGQPPAKLEINWALFPRSGSVTVDGEPVPDVHGIWISIEGERAEIGIKRLRIADDTAWNCTDDYIVSDKMTLSADVHRMR